MEFQAIIMAAGRGSRMTELTSHIPKPLLPVGNKPLIWYTVNMLENAGFEEVTLVLLKSVVADVQRALEELNVGIRLKYFTVADDTSDSDYTGTADSLRLLRDQITSDMLVVSCDLVLGDVEVGCTVLHQLADVHRMYDATVTMLLAPSLDLAESAMVVPGGRAQRRLEKDFIGLDQSGQRVLYLAAESDLDEIKFKFSELRRFPFIEINTNLIDCHLYFLKKSVLTLLVEDRSINTIKGDLIPLLLRNQLSEMPNDRLAISATCGDDDSNDHSFDDIANLVNEMSTFGGKVGSICQTGKEQTVCCAQTLSRTTCLRANTLLTYCEANKQIARQLSASLKASAGVQVPRQVVESVTGTGVTVGEKSTIKSTVIGDHCTIGDRIKMTNCVIMDHVVIESGVTLSGCVICSKARITSGSELQNCLVGDKEIVSGKRKDEIIGEQDHMTV